MPFLRDVFEYNVLVALMSIAVPLLSVQAFEGEAPNNSTRNEGSALFPLERARISGMQRPSDPA